MLKLLHIENIAVIESCDIEFEKGFNVLTGETGAGKSIIIDSICAVLGYRTTKDIIRNGAKKASVTAVFDSCSDEAVSWLSDNGFASDDGEIMISREISTDGKSSARINGKPVTASLLRNFGVLLINILGQHDSQQLLDVECHAMFVDRFAACNQYDKTLAEYSAVFEEFEEKKALRKKLDIDENAKARQVEMLKFQIEELESAELQPDEDKTLVEKQKIIRESVKIMECVSQANAAFSGEDDFAGICSALANASKALGAVASISDKLENLSNLVSELYYSADDIAGELRSLSDDLEFSEDDVNAVESRLDVIYKLKRKYGSSVEEMLSYLENAKKELSEIEFSEERIQILDSEINKLQEKAVALAEELLELRMSAAKEFENRIMRELSELDMKNARFVAKITKTEHLTARGCDTIEFLLAANLGEPERSLEKIASGGELSRIMLAMKNALDENDYVSTLIFDEIDTGVSGRAAQRIAEKLYKLSVKKQVLCVTHLAQISAMADSHFRIEKCEQGGRTYTNVMLLDESGKAEEIARITGGSSISETTLRNAREMLDSAKKVKADIKTNL